MRAASLIPYKDSKNASINDLFVSELCRAAGLTAAAFDNVPWNPYFCSDKPKPEFNSMSWPLLFLSVSAIAIVVAIVVGVKQRRTGRIMREGRLLKSKTVCLDGEMFYVEKVVFKDWHASLHSFYLISDRLSEGHTIVEQKWSYEDFCDVTIRMEDCTYALNRQVDVIALVRSFRPMPVEEFDRIARPLIMSK